MKKKSKKTEKAININFVNLSAHNDINLEDINAEKIIFIVVDDISQNFYYVDMEKLETIERLVQKKSPLKPVIYLDKNRENFLKNYVKRLSKSKYKKTDPWLFEKMKQLQDWINEGKIEVTDKLLPGVICLFMDEVQLAVESGIIKKDPFIAYFFKH